MSDLAFLGSCSFSLKTIADPEDERDFLGFAVANGRIICHLLDGARFYE